MIGNNKIKVTESEYLEILNGIDDVLDDFIEKINELKRFKADNDLLVNMNFKDKNGYVSETVIEQLKILIKWFNTMLKYKQLDLKDLVGEELYN